MFKTKKGDLSLSMNAIVILIIATVVLGLIMAFISGAFETLFTGFMDTAPKLKTQAADASNPLTLAYVDKWTIKKSTQETIEIGVYNNFQYTNKTLDGAYRLPNFEYNGEKPFPFKFDCGSDGTNIIIFEKLGKFNLKPDESKLVKAQIKSTSKPGTYICKFVWEGLSKDKLSSFWKDEDNKEFLGNLTSAKIKSYPFDDVETSSQIEIVVK